MPAGVPCQSQHRCHCRTPPCPPGLGKCRPPGSRLCPPQPVPPELVGLLTCPLAHGRLSSRWTVPGDTGERGARPQPHPLHTAGMEGQLGNPFSRTGAHSGRRGPGGPGVRVTPPAAARALPGLFSREDPERGSCLRHRGPAGTRASCGEAPGQGSSAPPGLRAGHRRAGLSHVSPAGAPSRPAVRVPATGPTGRGEAAPRTDLGVGSPGAGRREVGRPSRGLVYTHGAWVPHRRPSTRGRQAAGPRSSASLNVTPLVECLDCLKYSRFQNLAGSQEVAMTMALPGRLGWGRRGS